MAVSHFVQVTNLLTCDTMRRWLGRDQPVGTEGIHARECHVYMSFLALSCKAERPGKLRARVAQNSPCVSKGQEEWPPGISPALGLRISEGRHLREGPSQLLWTQPGEASAWGCLHVVQGPCRQE